MGMTKKEEIIKELAQVVNKHSLENESNTPDFLIAEHLYDCLVSYSNAIRKRNRWYDNTADNHIVNPMLP